ncbi:hypothetical protein COLO4_34628 [Corchorus olitorius]|uniref:Uncharacterized protein n=1 Tax=Corchorus olitorius TaxID=93759 RepID=A0A1R3GK54_9ROSI|nr:hypothetical protein COLO4_34628 [Corchorus olitorius]
MSDSQQRELSTIIRSRVGSYTGKFYQQLFVCAKNLTY